MSRAASAQTLRNLALVEVRVVDGVGVVPLTIDQIEGVLAIDINIVLDSRQVRVVDFQLTDLLPGFVAFHNVDVDTLKFAAAVVQKVEAGSGVFADLQVEDQGQMSDLQLSTVLFNDGQIPVEYAPRWVVPLLTAVAEEATLPDGNRLEQNYPNPFNAETTISFVVAKSAYVELVVYNAVGQTVRTLVGGQCAVGEHRIVWNGRDDVGESLASGRYVAKMVGADFVRQMAMTLLK